MKKENLYVNLFRFVGSFKNVFLNKNMKKDEINSSDDKVSKRFFLNKDFTSSSKSNSKNVDTKIGSVDIDNENTNRTVVLNKIKGEKTDEKNKTKQAIVNVHELLSDRGYQATNQIVGFLLSGDPTYITSYKEARKQMVSIERSEILKCLIENIL